MRPFISPLSMSSKISLISSSFFSSMMAFTLPCAANSKIGQVAVAACVSLVVILGVQQYGGSDSMSPQTDQLPVLQTVPFAGSAEPVSLTRESVERSVGEANMQEQRKRVHAMLRDYELQLRITPQFF